eukprot:TRINITY_DN22813_c0_g1_i1.p1 TRINITY_DN22813_c0_g1~~TRINITY_DN22813_c0_g1_i1.p1  ORF type:complete len:163 (+),score=71.91 TRINITY_DN22813_c0_g1_i1:64-552(+)
MVEAKDLQPPVLLCGKVVKGFQRGSKELGFPTANLAFATERRKLLKQGVYYGFCELDGAVYMMATSVGDNPHYGNEDVTVEVHILHTFDEDFYGATLPCVMVGYIRSMTKFDGLDALIKAIEDDCTTARTRLAEGTPEHRFASHPFLSDPKPEHAGELEVIL